MDQAIESNLWRILVLVILLTRLQASTGCSRRGPPTAPPKFGQSESDPLEMTILLIVPGLVVFSLILIIIERTVKIWELREDADLIWERNLKEDVERRAIQKRQTLDSSRTTIEKSNRQRARLQVQHNECCQSLASAQEQIGKLREDRRRKDGDLIQERNLKAEVERTLDSTMTALETSNRECTRLQVQYNASYAQEKVPAQEKIVKLREDGRRKDAELIRERNLKAEVGRTLDSTMTALETSNRECARLQVQYNAGYQFLASAQEKIEKLREDGRRKDADLIQARNLKAAVERRSIEITQTLDSKTATLETSNRECARLQEQVQRLNSELREERSCRDWIIPCDEIVISENELGRGSWGWVKEGTFRGTKVAVKQMHGIIVSPHNRRLFEREMKMAARSRHPNLLLFIGATNDDGIALLVTELLDTNLRTLLGRRRIRSREILMLSLDVSRALNYLHKNKPFPIIHRDISSANVLLFKREEAWHAKLSDYGSANFMKDSMTECPGAAIYAAPEARTSIQSPKLDVYSFGLLLCEMCTRELPVPGQRNVQISLITNDQLHELVHQCTNKTSRNRPTMDNVISTLQNLCQSRQ